MTATVVNPTLTAALEYVQAGLSVLPVALDGSKTPFTTLLPWEWNQEKVKNERTWKPLMERLATQEELQSWFGIRSPAGIGIIGGAVSGNLECLDFDAEAEAIYPAWQKLVDEEAPNLIRRLSVAQTPKPGFHVRYRVAGFAVPGNLKLAADPSKASRDRTLIETRGEGGYAVAPGSPAACHLTSRPYEHHTGPELNEIHTIAETDREILIRCARLFNRSPAASPSNGAAHDGTRPGDDFDRRGPDWSEILEPHGWKCVGRSGEERRWKRPGKDAPGWSATTGHCHGKDGADLLRVFSTAAAPFEEKAYGKFRAYALLNHAGDLSAAARELASKGYGEQDIKFTRGSSAKSDGQQSGSTPGEDKAPPKEEPNYQFKPLTSAEFAARVYQLQWLIQSTLVRGMPVIIGGPRKCLKTTLLLDLALSLGSATPFLNKFTVYKTVRTAILSGESGAFTLKETALRICAAKGIRLEDTNTFWSFDLPQLSNPAHLDELKAGLETNEIEVAIFDPLYLALLCGIGAKGLEASNLFDMGPLLRDVAQTCLSVGCTPILVHHSVKRLQTVYEPLELEDLAFAGIQEFARQWLLVNRREPFNADAPGSHKLWLSVGGSIGLAKLWAVDVDEGELQEDFSGRKWEVTVDRAAAARQEKKEQKNASGRQEKTAKEREIDAEIMKAVDLLSKIGKPATQTAIREQVGRSNALTAAAINRLLAERLLEKVVVSIEGGKGAKKDCTTYRHPLRDA